MTRDAFETCETITYEKDGDFYTDRIVGRVPVLRSASVADGFG